jgi:nucleotide-binding universal stress UspA family protein
MIQHKIKSAIIALDLTDFDENILEYVNFLSREIKIDFMTIVHISEGENLLSRISRFLSRPVQKVPSSNFLLEELADHFKQLSKKYPSEISVKNYDVIVQEGHVLEKLMEIIEEKKADLIVLGKKKSASGDGILTRNLLRKSENNILIVPEKFRLNLETITVFVDFSEYSVNALKMALSINQTLNKPAKIICLHVYELPDLDFHKINKTYEQMKAMVEEDIHEAFDNFINDNVLSSKDHIQKKITKKSFLNIASNLFAISDQDQTDLIFMGAKGHSRIENFILGSVTEKFIQINDSIPTMIIKNKND